MSLVFLGRIKKVGLIRNAASAIIQAKKPIRLLSSLVPSSSPYLLNTEIKNALREGSSMNIYDPRKGKSFTITSNKGLMMMCPSRYIGSSRGWIGFMNHNDSIVYLTNMVNHKVISLPPLDLDCPDSDMIINMSLSSFPDDQDSDFVVAIKFCGGRMCFCRPGDAAWTETKGLSRVLYCSNILYSNRDSRFYLTTLRLPSRTKLHFTALKFDGSTCKLGHQDFPEVTYYQN